MNYRNTKSFKAMCQLKAQQNRCIVEFKDFSFILPVFKKNVDRLNKFFVGNIDFRLVRSDRKETKVWQILHDWTLTIDGLPAKGLYSLYAYLVFKLFNVKQ